MHLIDLIASGFLILGTLYGAFVGPILAATTLFGLLFAAPFLYWFQPIFFNLFDGLQDDKLAYLLFFPIGYLVIVFSLKAIALRLDAYTKKMWLGGKHFWGTLTGGLLSVLIGMSVVLVLHPFVKEFSQKSFTESKIWNAVDALYTVKPEFYAWVCDYFKISELKSSMTQVGKIAPTGDFQAEYGVNDVISESDELEQLLEDREAVSVKQNQIFELLHKILQNRMNSTSKTIEVSVSDEIIPRPAQVSSPEI